MVKRDSAGSASRIGAQSPSINQLGVDHASVVKNVVFQDLKIKAILLALAN